MSRGLGDVYKRQDRDQYTKRQKLNSTKNKGSNWSAIFDYDISNEKHKEKPSIVINEQQPPEKITPLSINIEKKIVDTAKVPLTSTQIDLLQNGVKQNISKKLTDGIALKKPTIKLTSGTNIAIAADKLSQKDKNSTVLLPTVGFDFIKNNDTPSKKSPVGKTQEKPTLSFSSKPTSEKPLPKLSFGLGKPTKDVKEPIAKKPLSFGFNASIPERTTNKEDEDNDEEEPRRKKRAQPDISIDLTKGTNKPVFNFGQNVTTNGKVTPTTTTFSFGTEKKSDNDKKNESPEANKPSFTFGAAKPPSAATKPAFSFGAPLTKKPEPATTTTEKVATSFSFGVAKPTEQEKTTETKPAPSFSFGVGKETTVPATTEAPKSLFTADTSKQNSTTPSFSFGAKPATPNPVTETTPKPVFSFGAPAPAAAPVTAAAPATEATKLAVPSFSFSKPPGSTQSNDTTATKPAVPSFTFGAAKPPSADTPAVSEPKATPLFGASNPSAIPSTTPSFSFGKKPEENKSVIPSAPSSGGFSFARAPVPASTTAGIPTINPLMGNNPQPPSLGNQSQGSIAPPNTAGFNFNQPPANNASNVPSFNFGGNNNQANTGGSVFQSGGMGSNTGFNFGGQNSMNNNNAPSQPSFNPSTTANFNFGSAGSDPASVFNSSGPAMQPQQIFGGAPANNNNNNNMAQNNVGNSAGGPAGFSQRKFARMRAPRR